MRPSDSPSTQLDTPYRYSRSPNETVEDMDVSLSASQKCKKTKKQKTKL